MAARDGALHRYRGTSVAEAISHRLPSVGPRPPSHADASPGDPTERDAKNANPLFLQRKVRLYFSKPLVPAVGYALAEHFKRSDELSTERKFAFAALNPTV